MDYVIRILSVIVYNIVSLETSLFAETNPPKAFETGNYTMNIARGRD